MLLVNLAQNGLLLVRVDNLELPVKKQLFRVLAQ